MWLVDEVLDRTGPLPGLGVSGLSLWGINLQEMVYILTIVYLLLQIGRFIWKSIDEWRNKDD